jgi:hypothetical protein
VWKFGARGRRAILASEPGARAPYRHVLRSVINLRALDDTITQLLSALEAATDTVAVTAGCNPGCKLSATRAN